MADILDSAQQQDNNSAGEGAPASPSTGNLQGTSPKIIPPAANSQTAITPAANVQPDLPAGLISTDLSQPVNPNPTVPVTAKETADANSLMDTVLGAEKEQPTIIAPYEGPEEPLPAEPTVPPPPPAKNKGVILSVLLLLLITLPLIIYYASQQRQIADLRSRAAGPYPDGYECERNSQCQSGYCDGPKGVCWPVPTITSATCSGTQPTCSSDSTPSCINNFWQCVSIVKPQPDGFNCARNSQCSSGYCDPSKGVCWPVPTITSATCGGSKPICNPGSAASCINNYYTCVEIRNPQPDGYGCSKNSQCSSGYCDGPKGVCWPVPTITSAECNSGTKPTCSAGNTTSCITQYGQSSWRCVAIPIAPTVSNVTVNRNGCSVTNTSNSPITICTQSAGCTGHLNDNYCGSDWATINSSMCSPLAAGQTYNCPAPQVTCGSWQVDVAINPSPGQTNGTAAANGIDRSGCTSGGGGGGGGGSGGGGGNGGGSTSTSTTGTPPPSGPQCQNIKIFKGGQQVSGSALSSLQPGDNINITVSATGNGATKARVRINGGAWTESTTTDAVAGGYVVPFTVPAGITNFTIEGELFIGGAWQ